MTVSDSTRTVYVDPDTWWERLYVPDDAPAAGPAATAEEVKEVLEEEQPEPEPEPGRWRKLLLAKALPEKPEAPATAAPAPVEAPGTPGEQQRSRRAEWAKTIGPKRVARLRRASYTGTAALMGWSCGLPQYEQELLHVAAVAPAGTAALVLATASGTTAWRLFGRGAGPLHRAAQTAATCFAATVSYQFGPTAMTFAAEWGFTPALVAPLVTGIAVYAFVQHLIDRRTRDWWPPLAWVMRVPLASAALAMALYTTR